MSRVNPGELVEVDTPNTAVAIKKAGSYQLKVSATGDTSVVTVTDGSAEASAGARNVTLAKNQSATISGIQSPTVSLSAPTGAEHDRYFDARERRPESMSSAYVADGMVGTADLDDNGTWLSVRGYGMAWIPRVQKGWEPYRFGHWAWVDPWGWVLQVLEISLGASLRFTMGDGFKWMSAGPGCRAGQACRPPIHRRWLHGQEFPARTRRQRVRAWAGFRWDPTKSTCPRITRRPNT